MRGSALSSPMGVPLDFYSDIKRKGECSNFVLTPPHITTGNQLPTVFPLSIPFPLPIPLYSRALTMHLQFYHFPEMGFQRDSIPLAGFGAAPHNNSIGDTYKRGMGQRPIYHPITRHHKTKASG